MFLKLMSILATGLLVLSACGGGGGGGGEAADTTAPSISGVSVSAPSNGKVTLAATASDNKGVTGYCFKTDITAPAANNVCFTTDAAKSIDTPDTDITFYAWTKDAAGNVSTAFTKSLTDAVAPVVASVAVSAPNSGQLTLTVSASDTQGVTGYCFKTNATAPAGNDACFTTAVTSIISTPQTTAHYVWAKDAAGNISSAYAAGCSAAGVTASQNSALPTVCVSTSLGEFVVALESTKAPISTTTFLNYVNEEFYSQTVFHRVISNFMVQGGGYTRVPISPANAKVGTVYAPIALETTTQTGLSNTTGTIAMARKTELNTATHEFYINVVDNLFLNTSSFSGGYAVFGNVISGLNTTVQGIRGLPVQNDGRGEISQPLAPPIINWAYQLK